MGAAEVSEMAPLADREAGVDLAIQSDTMAAVLGDMAILSHREAGV